MNYEPIALTTFLFCLAFTAALAIRGGVQARRAAEGDLAGKSLNRWLVGLSAGATANSGFVVAAAVGLGYSYGAQWLLLPLAWLLGDLVFWRFFPRRLNAYGRETGATTLTDLIVAGLPRGRLTLAVSLSSATVIVLGMTTYTAGQWAAGEKFLGTAFGLSSIEALVLFGGFIILYSAVGGFRGSIYADAFQALLRILGTIAVFGTASFIAVTGTYGSSGDLPENFYSLFGSMHFGGAVAFIIGWAAAALSFGLGQPQVVTRYLAGQSPEETQKARWIYMGYLQLTWITMTAFGMVFRQIEPGLDPEAAEASLGIFSSNYLLPVLTGLILADIFSAIASTANSLLIAAAQSLKHDIFSRFRTKFPLSLITITLGAVTLLITWAVEAPSVFSLITAAVSIVGSGLASPIMIKVLGWRHTSASILAAMVGGVAAASLWRATGLGATLNEVAIGLTVGVCVNFAIARLGKP